MVILSICFDFSLVLGSFTISSWTASSRKETSTEIKPPPLPVHFEFCFIIHLIASSPLTALGQANHYTGLRNQFSLKPRTFQRGMFKIIYEHFQYCYQIAPSSTPCYCRAKQPWNSLDSHHFNEIKSQFLNMRIPPPIWFFFFFPVLSSDDMQRDLKTDTQVSPLRRNMPCPGTVSLFR